MKINHAIAKLKKLQEKARKLTVASLDLEMQIKELKDDIITLDI